jgi:hypothetical protein
MIFKIFSPKKDCEKLVFLTQNKAKLHKILIITLDFQKNANFFAKKLAKIAHNCDYNICPRLSEFTFVGRLFTLGIFNYIRKQPEFICLVLMYYEYCDFFHKMGWATLFTKASGHPASLPS